MTTGEAMAEHVLIARADLESSVFDWIFLIWYLLFGFLILAFLFFFNRLVAFIVSNCIRAYTWHFYRVQIHIEALQVSPLAGRIFFKGLRYYGRNETVLIQDGHITWRYWLRRVRELDHRGSRCKSEINCRHDNSPNASDVSDQAQPELDPQSADTNRIPCRLLLKVRGIQWFIYNRSAAYDTIARSMEQDHMSGRANNKGKGAEHASSSALESFQVAFIEKEGHVSEEELGSGAGTKQTAHPIDTNHAGYIDARSQPVAEPHDTEGIPTLLNILPIAVDCGKGAFVMGNQNTRSILVAKFDAASGMFTANDCQTPDLYKQAINFEFKRPLIHLKKNREFTDVAHKVGAQLSKSQSTPSDKYPLQPRTSAQEPRQRKKLARRFIERYIPASALFPAWSVKQKIANPDSLDATHETKWLGLVRYLDENDDTLEQERWRPIEYAHVPCILDCPSMSVSLAWDVPGKVGPASSLPAPPYGSESTINGGIAPEWVIEVSLGGGIINYGPWADRQRVDLQSFFFPTLYKDALMARPLHIGESRVYTEMKIVVILEDAVTLRIPTRETSKDWKWKGHGTPSAVMHPKHRIFHRERARDHSNSASNTIVRPFGWVDVKVQKDTAINLHVDLVAYSEGYRNRLSLDLKGTEVSTSVNHEILCRSHGQVITCDLRAPLVWNQLRQWRFDVADQNLELFILRDHIFLLTDLVNDWTAGPPSDFYTFTPFEYILSMSSTDFRIYLYANDSNVVDNPNDPEENTFIVIWGNELIADIMIPIVHHCPEKNQVNFDVEAIDGGLEYLSPAWNTRRTFLSDNHLASLKDLKIEGSYSYFNSTSQALTDTVAFDVISKSLRVQFYGFLMRYLLNIKDNYFGDCIHFRTQEEYQRQVGADDSPASQSLEAESHKRPSNDLDVIMFISAQDSCILLPANLYSSSTGIAMEISHITSDLRITNYYMDIGISISPIIISKGFSDPLLHISAAREAMTDLYIDGIEITGHRLFGLPPAEPTYICNWDFTVGSLHGQCSALFMKSLLMAMQSFALTNADKENARPPLRRISIHDITYLRANVGDIHVGLSIMDQVVLINIPGLRLEVNDQIDESFSSRLFLSLPLLEAAIMGESGINHQDPCSLTVAKASAVMRTSVRITRLYKKPHHDGAHALQQRHIALHDSRTHRAAWLPDQAMYEQLPTILKARPKSTTPALPCPYMPRPISEDRRLLKMSEHNNAVVATTISQNTSHIIEPFSLFISTQLTPTKDSPKPSLTLTSPFRQPSFKVLNLRVDSLYVPSLRKSDAEHTAADSIVRKLNLSNLDTIAACGKSCLMIQFVNGLSVLCTSSAMILLPALCEQFLHDDMSSLLDDLQVRLTKAIASHDHSGESNGAVLESQLLVPQVSLRFINTLGQVAQRSDQAGCFELESANVIIAARSSRSARYPGTTGNSHRLSCHMRADSVSLSMREMSISANVRSSELLGIKVQDPVIWLSENMERICNVQFDTCNISGLANHRLKAPVLFFEDLILLANGVTTDLKQTLWRQKCYMQSMIVLLSKEENPGKDPPFSFWTSHNRRGTTGNVRSIETWQFVIRLRHKLLNSKKDLLQYTHAQDPDQSKADATARLAAMIEQWHSWDLPEIESNVMIRSIFDQKPQHETNSRSSYAHHLIVRARSIRSAIEYAEEQSEITWRRLYCKARLDTLGTENQAQNPKKRLCSFQAYTEQISIVVHWSLCGLVVHIGELVQQRTFSDSPDTSNKRKSDPSLLGTLDFHLQVSTSHLDIEIKTPNVKVASSSRDLRASVANALSRETSEQGSTSLLICAGEFGAEVLHRNRILSVYELIHLRIFGARNTHRPDEASQPWKFTGSGDWISFSLKAEPLHITETLELLLRDEGANLAEWLRRLSPVRSQQKVPMSTSQVKGPVAIHIALFLNAYLIRMRILTTLEYQIRGEGVRCSTNSGSADPASISMNLDLRQQSHAIKAGGVAGDEVEVSTLRIPPITGVLKVNNSAKSKLIAFKYLVEHIVLNASSVHAIIDAINRPAIIQLGTALKDEITIMQDTIGALFNTGSKELSMNAHSPVLILYDAKASIAGLAIHASTPERPVLGQAADLAVDFGRISMEATNIDDRDEVKKSMAEFRVALRAVRVNLLRPDDLDFRTFGDISLDILLNGTSRVNDNDEVVRAFQIETTSVNINVHTDTASALVAIFSHLQNTLRTIEIPDGVKGLQKLGRARLQRQGLLPSAFHTLSLQGDAHTDSSTFSAMYSVVLNNIRIAWKIGDILPVPQAREPEDFIISFHKVELATRQDNAVRLLIESFQLQLAPVTQPIGQRSPNSALLPEVIFDVAYRSTKNDRKLVVQAIGKSVDIRLTSQLILPANDLRRSFAVALDQVRSASAALRTTPVESGAQKTSFLGGKRLASLLVYADFAGAAVLLQGRDRASSKSVAAGVSANAKPPQYGRYNQFIPPDVHDSSITLQAPGLALKVQYLDLEREDPFLSAEMKISASSNVLFPTVVPLILEISSSITEIIGTAEARTSPTTRKDSKIFQHKLLADEKLRTADPSAVLGNCKLNLGLRICKQDFTLSCQPIARVAAQTQFEDIYVTVNTVQSAQHGKFYTVAASFSGLRFAVQHVYSRESTGSFNVESVVLSCMNSRHVSGVNGISAILKMSPMSVKVNARQLQDFLLFREIWIPPEARQSANVPVAAIPSESQGFIMQKYQQLAATGAFPWSATISVAALDVQLDLGQSLGKTAFRISNFWISSRKSSDRKQNLCVGFEKIAVSSIGRMSGLIEMQNFRLRTSIQWELDDSRQSGTPLIQASMGLDFLKLKVGFDYQTFIGAEISTFEFLMYNVRPKGGSRPDRLVASLEGDSVFVFCTATSASQAYALYQAVQKLIEEKQRAYESSLADIEKHLRRKSSINAVTLKTVADNQSRRKRKQDPTVLTLQLQTHVVVTLRAVSLGAFPSTFMDSQVFKIEALETSASFAVNVEGDRIHSKLDMTLGELRVALSAISRPSLPKRIGELSVTEIVRIAIESKGGTILKVPKLVAAMQTWQNVSSTQIEYLFKSSFQGKVDVGWNYSRISYIRGMYANHARTLAQRLGKPLPQSAVQITGLEEGDGSGKRAAGEQEKITAVVNVPQSKYQYTALKPAIIETPQLRDMGEATPPLEWIGLHRERLPNLTHQIVIVTLLEIAKEVDDAYAKILGSS